MTIFKVMCAVAGGLALVGGAVAQETTASGNLGMEASWTALQALAQKASQDAKIAQIAATKALDETTKMKLCANSQKLFAPDSTHPKKNSQDCIPSFDPKELTVKSSTFDWNGLRDDLKCKTGGADTCLGDKVTTDHLCEMAGYSFVSGYSAGSWDSPKDNWHRVWNGKAWRVDRASVNNRPLSTLTCQRIEWK